MDGSRRYWLIVISLVDRGITTQSMWRLLDPHQYNEVLKCKEHGFRIRNILREVVRNMAMSKQALDYMLLHPVPGNYLDNPIYTLCTVNMIDPLKLATYMVCWASAKQIYTVRNTFLITGNSSTGARLLFDAISGSSPLVRYADWFHPENPFHRCVNSLMIVWDNGKIRANHLAIVKQVFAGEYILQAAPKPYLKFELFTKPVLAYANHEIFHIHHENYVDMSFKNDFMNHTFHLNLTTDIGDSIKMISINDVHQFVQWGKANMIELTDDLLPQA